MFSASINVLDPSDYSVIKLQDKVFTNTKDTLMWIIEDHFNLLYDNYDTECETFEEFVSENDLNDLDKLINYYETFQAYDSREYLAFFQD
jgi:hypothetical protein